MIQNAIHHLSYEQITFLNRGPTYVSPCQMHISSNSLSVDQIITKQMAPLCRQLTRLFNKYKIDLSRRLNFEQDIERSSKDSFSVPIPSSIQERALYEKQIIRLTQYQIKKDRLILRRTADENNTYYLGSFDEFNHEANQHIQNSNCYEMIGMIDENNTEHQQLTNIIQSINLALETLQQKRLINVDHLDKLKIGKKTNINLPYLYFLPETRQDGHIKLQPRISSCNNCPIQTLATYLDQLLRPLYENFSQSTTFISSGDFIQKLQYYCIQQDSLLPLTDFVTFKIHNLHTRVSHADIRTALNRFLHHPIVEGRHSKLTSDAIEELVTLVLQNNVFSYHGIIYRYTKGSPLNLPLTRLLFNIYLHNWQLPLVRQIRLADEFYGRYDDIGLMTWYGPTDKLQTYFIELNEQHPDVQITKSVGTHVHFLNAYIENRKGKLYTRVYHDPLIQPFLLPYAVDHPRLVHRQWFRFALIRAGQYCISLEDFEDERLYIELTFLANGYSLDFVEYHLQQFFTKFSPNEKRITLNRWTYPSFRSRLFRCIDEQKQNYENEQQLEKNHQLIQLSYLYDWGSRYQFNAEFIKRWSKILEQDATFKEYGLKIKLNSKHCYSSNTLLTQYKAN